MTATRIFLDSNIWLDYFFGTNPKAKSIMEDSKNIRFTSVLSLHEILRLLHKIGKTLPEAEATIELIEKSSVITDITKPIAVSAVQYCEEYGLHTIDALIYSSAQHSNAVLVTADHDFKDVPKTVLL